MFGLTFEFVRISTFTAHVVKNEYAVRHAKVVESSTRSRLKLGQVMRDRSAMSKQFWKRHDECDYCQSSVTGNSKENRRLEKIVGRT